MTRLFDSFDNCLAVIIHTPQLYAIAVFVGIKKNIGSVQPWRDRVADTTQIDDTYPPNLTIKRNMGMPYDDQVCLAASQPLLQLVIAMLWLDTGSVVSARRSMNS